MHGSNIGQNVTSQITIVFSAILSLQLFHCVKTEDKENTDRNEEDKTAEFIIFKFIK